MASSRSCITSPDVFSFSNNSKKLSVGDFSRFSIVSVLVLDRDGLRFGSGERMLLGL